MIRIFRIVLLLLFVSVLVSAEETAVTNSTLRQGLEELRSGNYDSAASRFREVLQDPAMEPFHSDALYWLVKTDIASGLYGEASRAAYRHQVMYPADHRSQEMEYQSARLLFLENEPEKAIVALGDFIDAHPDSEFLPSAHYWIGESLMVLGRLEEADAVFENLLVEYPSSVKREAARYRRSEISLMYRERELLDLLKWSHEEYLQDAEDFYRREAEFREAMEAYHNRFGDGTEADFLRIRRERLLEIKARLLNLQRFYVDELLGLSDVR